MIMTEICLEQATEWQSVGLHRLTDGHFGYAK